MLIPSPTPVSARKVDATLVVQAEIARRKMNLDFDEVRGQTGEEAAALMRNSRHQYDEIDEDFEGDCQLVYSVCGVNSKARLV